jgi:hypothetical protein
MVENIKIKVKALIYHMLAKTGFDIESCLELQFS